MKVSIMSWLRFLSSVVSVSVMKVLVMCSPWTSFMSVWISIGIMYDEEVYGETMYSSCTNLNMKIISWQSLVARVHKTLYVDISYEMYKERNLDLKSLRQPSLSRVELLEIRCLFLHYFQPNYFQPHHFWCHYFCHHYFWRHYFWCYQFWCHFLNWVIF